MIDTKVATITTMPPGLSKWSWWTSGRDTIQAINTPKYSNTPPPLDYAKGFGLHRGIILWFLNLVMLPAHFWYTLPPSRCASMRQVSTVSKDTNPSPLRVPTMTNNKPPYCNHKGCHRCPSGPRVTNLNSIPKGIGTQHRSQSSTPWEPEQQLPFCGGWKQRQRFVKRGLYENVRVNCMFYSSAVSNNNNASANPTGK